MPPTYAHALDDGHHHPGFVRRWLFSTNHKDIGILYLFASGLIGLLAVILSVVIRVELTRRPGITCSKGTISSTTSWSPSTAC